MVQKVHFRSAKSAPVSKPGALLTCFNERNV